MRFLGYTPTILGFGGLSLKTYLKGAKNEF